MSQWLYQGRSVTDKDIEGYKAFVYEIVNLQNNKVYIGKKRLTFKRSRPIKGSTRRRHFVKPSDWQDYWGSSEELAKDLHRLGKEIFQRRIIKFCKSTAESSYYELKEQVIRDVLLNPGLFYNSFVGCKIHRKHLLKEEK